MGRGKGEGGTGESCPTEVWGVLSVFVPIALFLKMKDLCCVVFPTTENVKYVEKNSQLLIFCSEHHLVELSHCSPSTSPWEARH